MICPVKDSHREGYLCCKGIYYRKFGRRNFNRLRGVDRKEVGKDRDRRVKGICDHSHRICAARYEDIVLEGGDFDKGAILSLLYGKWQALLVYSVKLVKVSQKGQLRRFGRAIRQLGIESMGIYSSQAIGRSARALKAY